MNRARRRSSGSSPIRGAQAGVWGRRNRNVNAGGIGGSGGSGG